jgi:hypothetical protein
MTANYQFTFTTDETIYLRACSKAAEWQRLSANNQKSYKQQVDKIFNDKVSETMGKEILQGRVVSKEVVEKALNDHIYTTYGDGTSQVNTPMKEHGNPFSTTPTVGSALAKEYGGQPSASTDYREKIMESDDEDDETESVAVLKKKMERLEFSNNQLQEQVKSLLAALGTPSAPIEPRTQQAPPAQQTHPFLSAEPSGTTTTWQQYAASGSNSKAPRMGATMRMEGGTRPFAPSAFGFPEESRPRDTSFRQTRDIEEDRVLMTRMGNPPKIFTGTDKKYPVEHFRMMTDVYFQNNQRTFRSETE